MTRVRSRSWTGPSASFTVRGSAPYTQILAGGTETIEDLKHDLSLLGTADCGGPMLLNRELYDYQLATVTSGDWSGSRHYVQPWPPAAFPKETDGNIKASGTTAIARSSPTAPSFQATTFLGEAMSDGLPAITGAHLWRDTTRDALKTRGAAHGSSSEFLNYQFGWVPFVNDLRNFAKSVKNSHKILSDFHTGSGKNTRVGYQFPPSSTTGSLSGTTTNLIRADNVLGGTVSGAAWETRQSRTWFNGCFTYTIPTPPGFLGKSARWEADANKLLGTRLTPSAVWNLAPWSWALDWFGNYGDVMQNLSQIGHDGLVLKYGYVMYHWRQETMRYAYSSPTTTAASTRYLQEVKKRFPASPFFGFATPGELSVRQVAILTALGINRA